MSVNGDPVDALSFILHKDNAYFVGKELCNKLKEIIPRQQFKVWFHMYIHVYVYNKCILCIYMYMNTCNT